MVRTTTTKPSSLTMSDEMSTRWLVSPVDDPHGQRNMSDQRAEEPFAGFDDPAHLARVLPDQHDAAVLEIGKQHDRTAFAPHDMGGHLCMQPLISRRQSRKAGVKEKPRPWTGADRCAGCACRLRRRQATCGCPEPPYPPGAWPRHPPDRDGRSRAPCGPRQASRPASAGSFPCRDGRVRPKPTRP